MITVYHANPMFFGLKVNEQIILDAIKSKEIVYAPVAVLRSCNSVEIAYTLTNTIDQDWWLNVGVTLMGEARAQGGARSTSIGDILVVHAGGERAYLCAPTGWIRLNQWVAPRSSQYVPGL